MENNYFLAKCTKYQVSFRQYHFNLVSFQHLKKNIFCKFIPVTFASLSEKLCWSKSAANENARPGNYSKLML